MGAFLLKLAFGAGGILKKLLELVGRFFAALNVQGWVGFALCLVLVVMLVSEKGETRHWHKQSGQFEKLYHSASAAFTKERQAFDREHQAFAQTVANYRAAAAQARAADKANAERVGAEQKTINERTSHDYEARIAAARAAAQRLRSGTTATNPGRGGTAPVPSIPATAGGLAQGSGEDGFSVDDRYICTAQAIQLDELIKWAREQSRVDVNGPQKGRQ